MCRQCKQERQRSCFGKAQLRRDPANRRCKSCCRSDKKYTLAVRLVHYGDVNFTGNSARPAAAELASAPPTGPPHAPFSLLPAELFSAILAFCGVEALFLRLRHVQQSWWRGAHRLLAARRKLHGSHDITGFASSRFGLDAVVTSAFIPLTLLLRKCTALQTLTLDLGLPNCPMLASIGVVRQAMTNIPPLPANVVWSRSLKELTICGTPTAPALKNLAWHCPALEKLTWHYIHDFGYSGWELGWPF